MGLESGLIWNIHTLNMVSHRDAICALVSAELPSLVCLQETKKVVITDFDVMQLLSIGFDDVYLPAI
jgi:exonuclease III